MSAPKKKKAISLSRLLWNDRFLIVFSVVVAIIFWAAVCVSFSPETTNVIKDVPIIISEEGDMPSQCNLQIFGDENFTVDITVSGSRYVIGENLLSADDFKVTAVTTSVATAGVHSLQVKASKVNEDANFTINSLSENFISVYYDSFAKKEMPVTVKLNKTDFVKTGYMTDGEFLMAEELKPVVVSGPALEIAQLDSVVADVQIPGNELSETTTCKATLTAYSANKTMLKYVQINGVENPTADIGIPIYLMGSHGLDVQFTNAPKAYAGDINSLIDYKFSPSSLNVAVLQNGTDIDKINIGEIDFSKIKKGENKFKFMLEKVANLKADSTKVNNVEVSFDLSKVAEKKVDLRLENVSVANAQEDIHFNNYYVTVQLYGKEAELAKLNPENLKAKIDMNSNTAKDGLGIYKGPVYISGSDSCWIYGTYELSYYTTK